MTTSESPTITPADVDAPLVSRPAVLAPVSLLLSLGGSSSYVYMLTIPAIRTTAWPTFAMLALGVLLGAAAVAQRRRWWTILPGAGTAVIAAVFLHTFFVGFKLPEAQAGPEPAEQAPDFALAGHQGGEIALSSYRGRGPVLLVFYRGAFCPFCQAEFRGLAGMQRMLEKAGGTVLAVSPDEVSECRRMATHCQSTFPILSDPDLKVIDLYGVRHPNGHDGRDVALSASFLIDAEGVIRWKFVGRTVQDLAHPDRVAGEVARLSTGQ